MRNVASCCPMAFSIGYIFCIWLLCIIQVKAAKDPHVFQRGNMKYIEESLNTSFDQEYVEYFHKVPNSEMLYTFRVVKLALAFTLDITVKVSKNQRIFYKAENVSGCALLSKPLQRRVFGASYKRLMVNGSLLRCPIKPKVYYINNEGPWPMMPLIHPPGRFELSVRVKMTESRQPFVMEMLWKYTIVRIK